MLRVFACLLLRICSSHQILRAGCLLSLIAGVTLFIADHVMVNASQRLTWSNVNAVPTRNVGLLLGAGPGNRYSTRRINTAAELYHTREIKWPLVSDDNGCKNYDEASGMQQALIVRGVPTKAIFCDYAEFPTLDSAVYTNKVFSESRIAITSQEFHNQRVIRLAEQYGIDAIGFSAPDLNMKHGSYTQLREKLTRVGAVIDVEIFHRQPKYFGSLTMIGPFSEHDCPAKK